MDSLRDTEALKNRIQAALHRKSREGRVFPRGVSRDLSASAVLFLLGNGPRTDDPPLDPCVILNKRSRWVKQPGDLCFPGGRMSPGVDPVFARLLRLAFLPLGRFPHWRKWRRDTPNAARRLSLLLATSLRESIEEMRLNPFWVRFLGPLPAQQLVMFKRIIYPMVGWISVQRRFYPNWEVESLVPIRLRDLLDPSRYACYRLSFAAIEGHPQRGDPRDFEGYIHGTAGDRQVLWGATYRIILAFLDLIFDFQPPPMQERPVISGSLHSSYFTGGNGP